MVVYSLVRSGLRSAVAALLALPILAVATAVHARDLKVATWNLDWLSTRAASARYLPPDVTLRQDADIARLAAYARDLDADVIAVEEVDNHQAAAALFPPGAYSIHMTRDHVLQRVGIAVRRGIPYDINPDLTALAQEHLRSGADITLHLPGHDLRLLAVHLKKGCRNGSLTRSASGACQDLAAQVGPLRQWIDDRTQAGEPFLILGDFNRWMEGRDPFLQSLRSAAPLARATQDRSSPCWGGEHFIDHILAGGPAIAWMQPDSLKVLVYRETDPSLKDRLSDHCPVSVRVVVPE